MAELHAVPSGPAGPDVQVQGLTVSLADVRAGGVLAPKTAAGAPAGGNGTATGDVTVTGRVTLQNAQVARATPVGLAVRLGAVELNLNDLQAPGLLKRPANGSAMAGLGAVSLSARLALTDAALDNVTATGTTVGLGSLDLGLDDVRVISKP